MEITVAIVLEYIGVAAFALSGAYIAITKKMDVFGIYVMAFATACGGGIMRDVVMDVGVPKFFNSYPNMIIVILVATIAMSVKWSSTAHRAVMTASDAIGLGIFAIDAGVKAIDSGYNLPQFLFVSTITAVGGGVIRDLLCQRVPAILRKEVYASCAMLGALVLWFVYPLFSKEIAMYISLSVVIIARIISVAKDIHLPVPKHSSIAQG